ncbi:unnamed protein product [Effrenium voratum]|nr:unnamed protein product [Effrenium voratum]
MKRSLSFQRKPGGTDNAASESSQICAKTSQSLQDESQGSQEEAIEFESRVARRRRHMTDEQTRGLFPKTAAFLAERKTLDSMDPSKENPGKQNDEEAPAQATHASASGNHAAVGARPSAFAEHAVELQIIHDCQGVQVVDIRGSTDCQVLFLDLDSC